MNFKVVQQLGGSKQNVDMASSTRDALLKEIAPIHKGSSNKVTIVGVGQVGMAVAFSILTQGVSSDIVLIDAVKDRLMGEMLDLQHGALFLKNPSINASTDYAASAGSRLCIVTAGVRQQPNETRLSLLQRNIDVLKVIIPQLTKHSPKTILLIVSNPVDALTYIAWKLSGLPKHRVIGSGTNLDSSRFRFLLSQKLGVSPTSCHGWIIGEHGDSSVAVWSGVNVAGVRLRDINPNLGKDNDPEHWEKLHEDVVQAAYEIIRLKGYTNWAVGLSVASLAYSILRNTFYVHAVSVNCKGYHGIDKDVFLSLPAVLSETGVSHVVIQSLHEYEISRLQESAAVMDQILSEVVM